LGISVSYWLGRLGFVSGQTFAGRLGMPLRRAAPKEGASYKEGRFFASVQN